MKRGIIPKEFTADESALLCWMLGWMDAGDRRTGLMLMATTTNPPPPPPPPPQLVTRGCAVSSPESLPQFFSLSSF